jgi:hypothetical protein
MGMHIRVGTALQRLEVVAHRTSGVAVASYNLLLPVDVDLGDLEHVR